MVDEDGQATPDRKHARDLCPFQMDQPLFGSMPGRPSIQMATVYHCSDPLDADQKLGGHRPGYVYQRDGQPNAIALAEKCRQLHRADRAVVTSSGMSATALAMIANVSAGEHILLSNRLYGKTTTFVKEELGRLGINHSICDMSRLDKIKTAIRPATRMVVVESISNPMLHVLDLDCLADVAHEANALLLVDNTFASPIISRPLENGADLVVESMTKIMNGHGDVTMGLLCGNEQCWDRVAGGLTAWGMTPGPMACWLADRGLATLYLRVVAASQTAMTVAAALKNNPSIKAVHYPGLASNAESYFSKQNLDERGNPLFGNMVTIELDPQITDAASFIRSSKKIPFCPSLGDMNTMLTHPATTSHRGLSKSERMELGIGDQTIRFSIGLESSQFIIDAISEAIST